MTKVIILGEQPEKKDLKPIQFVKYMNSELKINSDPSKSKLWKNIELICRNYSSEGLDLMFAYDYNRSGGVLYLGHFNDGIV
jgi:hypothetical protein